MKKPTLAEQYADVGQYSYWSLVDSETGKILWAEGKEGSLPAVVHEFLSAFDEYVHDAYLSPEGGDILKVEKAFHKVCLDGAYVSPYDLPIRKAEPTEGEIISANLRLPLYQKPPIPRTKE